MSMSIDFSSSSSLASQSSNTSSSSSNNVQVAVRCRPMSIEEKRSNAASVVSCQPDGKCVNIQYGAAGKKLSKAYNFDKVFGMYSSQEEVFNSIVRPIVDEVLAGFNCTIFAYGQTGTGKTHTMEGDMNNEENAGIIPRAVKSIFEQLESSGAEFTIRVSFLELYNEELQDLLVSKGNEKKLKLCEDERKGVICQNLEEITVLSARDIFEILKSGIQNRQTAATLCNKHSSRSHSIFTMKIMVRETNFDGEEVVRHGQLNLVDLAGSECVKRSGANEKGKEQQAREAGNINQSLLTLGRVITALVDHHGHIPYRDSKLTRLLQESLGGKAKTCIIATLSPISSNIDETMSTLDYAHRARSIKNQPTVNQKMTKKVVLKEYCEEIEYLRSQLQITREKNGIFMDPNDFHLRESKIATLESQLAECEGTLKVKSEELKQAKGIKDSLIGKIQELDRKVNSLSESLMESENSLSIYKDYLRASQSVVSEQAVTEDSLFNSASTLQEEVVTRRNQLQKLFDKLDRSKRCEQLKSAELKSFVMSAKSSQLLLSRSLMQLADTSAIHDAKESLEAINTIIEKARSTCNSLNATMHETVSQTSSQITKGQEIISSSCSMLTDDLTQTHVDQTKAVESLQSDLLSWLITVKAQADRMNESMNVQEQKISDFQSEFSKYITSQEASIDSFLITEAARSSEFTDNLLKLRVGISQLVSRQSEMAIQQAHKNNSSLTNRIKAIEEFMTKQLNELANESMSSCEGFVAEMDTSSSESNACITTSTQSLLDKEAIYYASTQEFALAQKGNLQMQMNSLLTDLPSYIQPSATSIRSDISSLSSSVGEKEAVLSEASSKMTHRSFEYLQIASSKVENLLSEGTKTLGDVSGALQVMQTNMTGSIDGDFVTFLDSHGVGCKNQLMEHFSKLESSLTSIASDEVPAISAAIDAFEQSYHREELQVLPSGDSPVKANCDLNKPEIHLSKTRSHEIIITEALSFGDNTFAKGGHKVYDISLLLPMSNSKTEEEQTETNESMTRTISDEGSTNSLSLSHTMSTATNSNMKPSLVEAMASTSPRKRKSGEAALNSKTVSSVELENVHPNHISQSPNVGGHAKMSRLANNTIAKPLLKGKSL